MPKTIRSNWQIQKPSAFNDRNVKPTASLTGVPNEVLYSILAWLPTSSHYVLFYTDSHFRQILNEPEFKVLVAQQQYSEVLALYGFSNQSIVTSYTLITAIGQSAETIATQLSRPSDTLSVKQALFNGALMLDYISSVRSESEIDNARFIELAKRQVLGADLLMSIRLVLDRALHKHIPHDPMGDEWLGSPGLCEWEACTTEVRQAALEREDIERLVLLRSAEAEFLLHGKDELSRIRGTHAVIGGAQYIYGNSQALLDIYLNGGLLLIDMMEVAKFDLSKMLDVQPLLPTSKQRLDSLQWQLLDGARSVTIPEHYSDVDGRPETIEKVNSIFHQHIAYMDWSLALSRGGTLEKTFYWKQTGRALRKLATELDHAAKDLGEVVFANFRSPWNKVVL